MLQGSRKQLRCKAGHFSQNSGGGSSCGILGQLLAVCLNLSKGGGAAQMRQGRQLVRPHQPTQLSRPTLQRALEPSWCRIPNQPNRPSPAPSTPNSAPPDINVTKGFIDKAPCHMCCRMELG
jgi:hypothetical protein